MQSPVVFQKSSSVVAVKLQEIDASIVLALAFNDFECKLLRKWWCDLSWMHCLTIEDIHIYDLSVEGGCFVSVHPGLGQSKFCLFNIPTVPYV